MSLCVWREDFGCEGDAVSDGDGGFVFESPASCRLAMRFLNSNSACSSLDIGFFGCGTEVACGELSAPFAGEFEASFP